MSTVHVDTCEAAEAHTTVKSADGSRKRRRRIGKRNTAPKGTVKWGQWQKVLTLIVSISKLDIDVNLNLFCYRSHYSLLIRLHNLHPSIFLLL